MSMGDLQLGIESYQTKITFERPNWMSRLLLQRKNIRFDGVGKSHGKAGPHGLRLSYCSVNKGHEGLGSGQRMTEKRSKDSHCNREKTTDQEDLSKSRKLCWRKNKRY
ncbi:hypothetical protein Tco_1312494 [Tanacetum coccineum]